MANAGCMCKASCLVWEMTRLLEGFLVSPFFFFFSCFLGRLLLDPSAPCFWITFGQLFVTKTKALYVVSASKVR